jgi:hypothetical protein
MTSVEVRQSVRVVREAGNRAGGRQARAPQPSSPILERKALNLGSERTPS